MYKNVVLAGQRVLFLSWELCCWNTAAGKKEPCFIQIEKQKQMVSLLLGDTYLQV